MYVVYAILFAQVFTSVVILGKNLVIKFKEFRGRDKVVPMEEIQDSVETGNDIYSPKT